MGVTAALVNELEAFGDWGLITTDTHFVITKWNRWFERHTGKPAETVLGRSLFEVFPDLLDRRFDRSYHQALTGLPVILSQRLHKYVLPLPPISTTQRFEHMQQTTRIVPLTDGDKVCGTVTVVEDVTERVAYELELRDRVAALREQDRRKDEFLAMLSHELRNPLAPISNAAQILRLSGVKDPPLVRARDMIERQVNHLIRLVDDLLDVSRVSRGKIRLQSGPLALGPVVQHALETSRAIVDARRHTLELSIPSESVVVDGDSTRLAQVVSNLLNNAAKYTDQGGQIWLELEKTQTEAIIRVRDTGRGIDPSTLPNLFELFYQVDRNLDRSDGGLGIGLSLVRTLVEMHGGRVEAHSQGPGHGSEFVVYLPLLEQSEALMGPAAPSLKTSSETLILVVDDNVDSAESMAEMLRMEGHVVLMTHDGKKAVDVALAKRPAVVLLDIGLPGLDGYQACRAMRDQGLTEALIVAMTGYGQKEDRRQTQEAGFDAHQVKPVPMGTIRELLQQRRYGRTQAR